MRRSIKCTVTVTLNNNPEAVVYARGLELHPSNPDFGDRIRIAPRWLVIGQKTPCLRISIQPPNSSRCAGCDLRKNASRSTFSFGRHDHTRHGCAPLSVGLETHKTRKKSKNTQILVGLFEKSVCFRSNTAHFLPATGRLQSFPTHEKTRYFNGNQPTFHVEHNKNIETQSKLQNFHFYFSK